MRQPVALIVVMLAIVGLSAGAAAQVSTLTPNVRIERVPPRATSSTDGAELYDAYCMVCHGSDLRGYGAAWHFCTEPPMDLRKIGLEHGNSQDREAHIVAAIKSHSTPAANGDALDMPDWVVVFGSFSRFDTVPENRRVAALAKYIVLQTSHDK